MKLLLIKWIFPRLFRKSCESRIPRSGERGRAVNCFVIALDKEGEPYFLGRKIEGEYVHGEFWKSNSYSEPGKLPVSDFSSPELHITHYWGLSTIAFTGVYDLVWNYVSRSIYLKLRLRGRIENSSQYFFNRKRLVSKRRMDLLKFLIDEQIHRESAETSLGKILGEQEGIEATYLLQKSHSHRIFQHPSVQTQKAELELNLKSLVETGELTKVSDTQYRVTGLAISTIEKYEELEQRHTEAVKLQKKMFWLTLVAVCFAIVQSGVIKLPTVIDLSSPEVKENGA